MDFQTQLAHDYHYRRRRYYMKAVPLALLVPLVVVVKSSEERAMLPFLVYMVWVGLSFFAGMPILVGGSIGYIGMSGFFLYISSQHFKDWDC